MFRRYVVLVFVGALMVLIAPVSAQKPAKRIDDDSDWWSLQRDDKWGEGLKDQNRTPASSNYMIQGVSIWDNKGIAKKFGPTTEISRGDAASGRQQFCYTSPDHRFHFVIEYGEVVAALYMFDTGPDWKGSRDCAVSKQVSYGLATGSGIKLGMTPKQLALVLGKPNRSNSGEMLYLFSWKSKPKPKDVKALRAENPKMSDEEFRSNFGSLDVSSFVVARFSQGKLTYLAVLQSETY